MLSFAFGFGVGLIVFAGAWLLFQWPETRRLKLHLEDREDMVKELSQLREQLKQAKGDIADRDQRLAAKDAALAQANDAASTYKAQAEAARQALEDADQVDDHAVKVRRILALADENRSRREIEETVFGYTGGHANRVVSEVLDGATTR
jgi:chromosome segregation ATPase